MRPLMETQDRMTETTPTQMVDALNATFGRHPHQRASHAKGLFASGVFIPAAHAGMFSASPAFSGETCPVTARFSLAGGNPMILDKAPVARGLSISIALPGNDRLVLVMISAPVFFAASRESFVAFLEARRPDPATGKPNAEAVARSNQTHTDSEAQRRWLAAVPPSVSYATSPYFAVHTYLFARPDGTKSPARWVFEPVAGRIGLTAEALKDGPDNFLDAELAERLATAPAEWRVLLQFPEAIDPLHNPTAAWPETRKTLEVGRLRIDGILDAAAGDPRDRLVFDPLRMPGGIEAAGDPIFSSRSEAYSVSAERRYA
jgi:catalase